MTYPLFPGEDVLRSKRHGEGIRSKYFPRELGAMGKAVGWKLVFSAGEGSPSWESPEPPITAIRAVMVDGSAHNVVWVFDRLARVG